MHIKRIAALIMVMVIVAVMTPIAYILTHKTEERGTDDVMLIELWQIDGFEGGKGSRAKFLSDAAKKCFSGQNIYFNVTSLNATAARENLALGHKPDLISYNAGFSGIENYVNQSFGYTTWCNGAYCLIALDASADFSDVNSQNTVINAGKDNLVDVAAAVAGLCGAARESSVNAYLKLLDGSYRYLLGTQRDIYRFISRKVEYSVKPLTGFNDLYQNISVLTHDKERCAAAEIFIDYLVENNNVKSLGLFSGKTVYEDNQSMANLAAAEYSYRLTSYCSEDYISQLKNAVSSGDINKIKNLLK